MLSSSLPDENSSKVHMSENKEICFSDAEMASITQIAGENQRCRQDFLYLPKILPMSVKVSTSIQMLPQNSQLSQ